MKKDPAHPIDDGEESVKIWPASTVILLREPFKVFMVQRERNQDFLAGICVFPGGKMDAEDHDEDLIEHAQGFDGSQARDLLNEPELDEHTALGLFFAAIRELFEEAGILLAYKADGSFIEFSSDSIREKFNDYRTAIHEKELSLKDLARLEKLTYAVDTLLPYSHWITPDTVRKRFDTRFFIAKLPQGQKTDYDPVELMGYEWRTPDIILEQNHSAKIKLIPPTLKTIEELSLFKSIDDVISHVRSRPIYPILPQVHSENNSIVIKLPHDPEYSIDAYKQPPSPDDPSRLVFKDGIWKTSFYK
jgi:8-oxo-dGTP pyrophosphatase MutT (NUDIX family)